MADQRTPDDVDEHGLPIWSAAERNKEPIATELVRILEGRAGLLLELAAATGQHAVHFAARLPAFQYQTSDQDLRHIETLSRRAVVHGVDNLLAPVRIDVTESRWPIESCEVIYNANMIHIAPWAVTEGLMAGAERLLSSNGLLLTYGPYKVDGRHTAKSNEAFDESLRSRDESWGVRDIGELETVASRHGIELEDRVEMPTNNFLLIWKKS